MLSEALWGLAAAGGTAMVGAAATDVWRSARLRIAGLLDRGEPTGGRADSARMDSARTDSARTDSARVDPAQADPAVVEAEPVESRPGRIRVVQHNIALDGGAQHITLSGDINVGRDGRVSR